MSGSGRKSSYRKTITDSVLYGDPEPGENESIVKVVSLKGSNLMEVSRVYIIIKHVILY